MESNEMVTITKAEYERLIVTESEVAWLKHQLSELKRLIHGAKSERFVAANPDQSTLFDLPAEHPGETKAETITYTRNKPQQEKKQPLRLELPSHLERREEIIEPENLPANAKKIGETVTEVLEYEPASAYVRRIIRRKYIVEANDEETIIAIAPLPTLPIPKGNAGASMIAHILVSKFGDHLPFYRQRQIFKRQDLDIAESTINGWFNAGCDLLHPLYDALKTKILSGWYLMADETPIAVLTQDKPGATHKGFHWVYYDPVNKLVLFDYRKSRGREGPDEMLKEFSGYLQTDGYGGYSHFENTSNIKLLSCMAHARRKFEHAQENNPALAEHALKMFQDLYKVESEARQANLSFDELKDLRGERSKPVLEQMEIWLKEQIIIFPQRVPSEWPWPIP